MKNIVLIVILMLSEIVGYGQAVQKTQNSATKDMEQMWERLIEAKGGREKLLKIENIVKQSRGTYYTGLKKINTRSLQLIVLPNKWWSWTDERPSIFGLRMTMYNFDIDRQYVVQYGGRATEWGIEPIQNNNKRFADMTFISYLLPETKYWKPTLEKVDREKIGFRDVDVIQTRLKGKRIDFFLDRKTHLPIKVVYFMPNIGDEGEHLSYVTELSDYVEYRGIQVPTKVNNQRLTYQFNIEYNEEIFQRPPVPIETSDSAWRKK